MESPTFLWFHVGLVGKRGFPVDMSAASTRAPAQSAVDELEHLTALHDRGVLTDLEFEAQKAKILRS
jgi:hypothetical protein